MRIRPARGIVLVPNDTSGGGYSRAFKDQRRNQKALELENSGWCCERRNPGFKPGQHLGPQLLWRSGGTPRPASGAPCFCSTAASPQSRIEPCRKGVQHRLPGNTQNGISVTILPDSRIAVERGNGGIQPAGSAPPAASLLMIARRSGDGPSAPFDQGAGQRPAA